MTELLILDPATPRIRRRGGARRDGMTRLLIAIGAVVAVFLLLPLVMLALGAHSAGWTEIRTMLFRERSLMLLRHTVILSILVTVLTGVIGTAAAWCTERTALPLRRVWTVLLVLPVAMPDFVVGYSWHTIRPTMAPLAAATLVMTLASYPLVYLPVAAALRRVDPAMEESARTLGIGKWQTFFRVTLPLIRPAVLGGCLIVVLTVLSEYGAFEIVRYQTFTTEIFAEFQFSPDGAAALSIPLVLLGLLILGMDGLVPRRPLIGRVSPQRQARRSGFRSSLLPMTGLTALVGLGVAVPLMSLVYWMTRSQHTTLPAVATLGTATLSTVTYSALGALLAVVLALPVAFMSARRNSTVTAVIERSTFVTQALPGVVIALSLVYFAINYAFPIYQSGTLLVLAYVVMHFPLALVCVKTSALQAPRRLADVGRSLGKGPVEVFIRVTLPLVGPGIIAAFCLVFATAATELTATLVLAPLGVETLATQFWAFQSETAYGAAAPYAMAIVALAVVPGALLGLWFDHERHAHIDEEVAQP